MKIDVDLIYFHVLFPFSLFATLFNSLVEIGEYFILNFQLNL
jgi:hypothetical protein